MTESRGAKKWVEFYARMQIGYAKKAERATNVLKMQRSNGKAIFCIAAIDSLRNSNSSSVLERSFSDALRCVSDKRVTNSAEHISQETTLRQFKRAKDDVIDLARDSGYKSDKLEYLISLVAARNLEDPERINYDSDEVTDLSFNKIKGSSDPIDLII